MSLQSLASKSNKAGSSTADMCSIVLIDDDVHVLRALSVALGKTYKVNAYIDPVEGAKAAVAKEIDLLITDIKMPTHDGFWVFDTVRKSNADIPIIFNSAYQDIKLPLELHGAYAPFAYVQKNGRLSDFLELVRQAIVSSRGRRMVLAKRATQL